MMFSVMSSDADNHLKTREVLCWDCTASNKGMHIKPRVRLKFSERVLGLICLWNARAIVVGCPSWLHQWCWWDSNPRPFDHESQAYPLSHDRKGMHVNHLKIPAPALINNQFLLTGRERSGLLIFYEWPGLWLYSIVYAKNILIGVVETECVTVDQYLIGIYHAPTIVQILFTLDCLNSVGITMD